MRMYQMFIVVQYIGIFVLLFELYYIMTHVFNKCQNFLAMMALTALLNNVGYLFKVTSNFMESAVMSNKISYMGKAFIPLIMLMFCLEYCKYKVPKWIPTVLGICHALVLLLVLTNEYHYLYYTSVEYSQDGLFPHLVLGHGVIYYLYMVLNILYMIVMMMLCAYRYIKNDNKKERKQLIYIVVMIFVMMLSLGLFMADLTYGIDTTVFGYVISSVILLFSIFKDNLFDTLSIAKDYALDSLGDGLIVFNKSSEVIYYNSPAQNIFKNIEIETGDVLLKDLSEKSFNSEKIFSEGKIYGITERTIIHNDVECGIMYLLADITDSYNYMERLEKDVEKKTKEITKIQRSVIASFANMVEARDGVTGLHIKNTSTYVKLMVEELRKLPEYKDTVTQQEAEIMVEAAPLHDIGKIAVADYILTKPGKLTKEEFEVIKKHASAGAEIISETLNEVEKSEYLTMARDMAHYHHEKWDGSGYPCGLKGEEIPLCARIMAIADVYDALRSKRSYKEAYSIEKAMEIMRESSGTHFDPELLEIFLDNIVKLENERECVE